MTPKPLMLESSLDDALMEIGRPDLGMVLDDFVKKHRLG
jgi:hypothetical protein